MGTGATTARLASSRRSNRGDASGLPARLPRKTLFAAQPLGDHRLAYLHEEGPLSGNRGAVSRIDAGTYVTSTESAENWELTLSGEVLRGRIQLRLSLPQWTLTCEPGS